MVGGRWAAQLIFFLGRLISEGGWNEWTAGVDERCAWARMR